MAKEVEVGMKSKRKKITVKANVRIKRLFENRFTIKLLYFLQYFPSSLLWTLKMKPVSVLALYQLAQQTTGMAHALPQGKIEIN